jgi:hypothetical protein
MPLHEQLQGLPRPRPPCSGNGFQPAMVSPSARSALMLAAMILYGLGHLTQWHRSAQDAASRASVRMHTARGGGLPTDSWLRADVAAEHQRGTGCSRSGVHSQPQLLPRLEERNGFRIDRNDPTIPRSASDARAASPDRKRAKTT